jgi:hypothetical protein
MRCAFAKTLATLDLGRNQLSRETTAQYDEPEKWPHIVSTNPGLGGSSAKHLDSYKYQWAALLLQ